MANIPIQNNAVRLQSGLPSNTYKEYNTLQSDTNLLLATIVSVNYTQGTAKLSLNSSTSNSIVSNVLLPVDSFNTNMRGEVYGTYKPIEVGSTVLVGFINNNKTAPIILGVYPNNKYIFQRIAPTDVVEHDDSEYPIRDEALSNQTVYPSQQIKLVTETGDYLRTFDGRSMLNICKDPLGKLNDPNYNGFYDRKLRHSDGDKDLYRVKGQAQKFLLLHQSNLDSDNHRTRFFIDQDGSVHNLWFDASDNSHVVMEEINKDDGYKLRFQHDVGTFGDSEEYSEITVDKNNNINLLAFNSGSKGSIVVSPEGTIIDGLNVASEDNFKELSAKFKQLREDIDRFNEEINSVGSGYISTLPDTIGEIKRDIGTNQRAISLLTTDMLHVKADTSALSTKVDSVQQATVDTGKILNDKIDKIDNKLINYSTLESDVSSLNTRVPKLEGSVNDYELNKGSYLTDSSEVIKSLQQDNSNLKTSLQSTQSELTDLQAKYSELSQEVKEIKDSLNK